MDYLQSGQWEKDFIDAIEMYTDILYEWVQINPSFYHIINSDITYYTAHEWPEPIKLLNSTRRAIEIKLVTQTIQRIFDISGSFSNRGQFRKNHAYKTFIYFVIRLMKVFWGDFIQEANFETSGYFDHLIRTCLIHSPGIGISYLCLKIASKVKLTKIIFNEIECSRHLSPKLPFASEDLKSLLRITNKEIRLRLGLCLAQELGQAAAKLHVEISTLLFDNSIWDLMHAAEQYNNNILDNVPSNDQSSHLFEIKQPSLESINLTLLGECLKYSS